MTTEVRTFTADTMQQALDIVRKEMGSDAVILHTRQIEKRRMLPWPKSWQEVEITAGTGVVVGKTTAKPQAAAGAGSMVIAEKPATTTRRMLSADDLAPPPQLLKTDPKPSSKPATPAPAKPTTASANTAPSRLGTRAPMPARAESLIPKAPVVKPIELVRPTPTSMATDATLEIHKRLDALQQALAELSRQAQGRVADEVPVELYPHYTKLLQADVEEPLARELMTRLKREVTAEQLANAEAAKALLTALIEREIRCTQPIRAQRGRRKVVALVGPTGVGKTTTIAKLAANFRLKDGLKLGLVTVDTYRVAAVEQLRTYAEIIDLPMKVVTSPQEMRRALEDLSGVDLVLIDTAGRSPNDELKLQELKTLLETGVDEVHLVLSLAGGTKSLEATAEKFSSIKPASVILTKLDEAMSGGSLLTVARRIAAPISYVTAGQNVPEDIEPAHPAKLANWLWGTRV